MIDTVRGGRNAAALAILALSALLLTPFLFQRTIAQHRAYYSRALDPAREASSEVLLSLAREVGAVRGYLLTGDTSLLSEYRVARAAQDRALERLAAVRDVDSATYTLAGRLESAVRDWNGVNDLLAAGRITPAEARSRLSDQQDKYTAALDAGDALDGSIVSSVNGMRARVGSLERWWVAASMGLALLAGGAALIVVFMMRLSHRQSALARTDSLTGLYNRLGFEELATRELRRARRHGGPVTLMWFDLDGFKQVNDRRGHAAGDQLLRAVSKATRSTVRDIDVAARVGGDEFAVLLPDNRAVPPERAVERVRDAIAASLSRERWPVTLSVGAVTVRNSDAGIDEMIQASDTLLYQVKAAGKNGICHRTLSRSATDAPRAEVPRQQ
ncbi:MAG TPA: diguanylate cyclase [Gemmatimonadaceae bacterium]|nr:diguanylate cyclase [Gemmatimonadaceae bacterium]